MYYADGELNVYQSNKYKKYTIRTGDDLPGVPEDYAIESIYFYKTGATGQGPGVYKYDGIFWKLTNIGNSPGEYFTYMDNDGKLVTSISAS